MKQIIGYLLFTLALLLTSCSEETTDPGEMSTDVFPLATGNEWNYVVYDSISAEIDTLTIRISGEINSPDNKPLKVWQIMGKNYTDSLYLFISDNEVIYYSSPDNSYIERLFNFPLEVGKSWNNPSVATVDSYYVASRENITTPAGNFNNAYKIQRTWAGFNEYGYSETWFVPDIGIVKYYVNEQNVTHTEVMELLSYSQE